MSWCFLVDFPVPRRKSEDPELDTCLDSFFSKDVRTAVCRGQSVKRPTVAPAAASVSPPSAPLELPPSALRVPLFPDYDASYPIDSVCDCRDDSGRWYPVRILDLRAADRRVELLGIGSLRVVPAASLRRLSWWNRVWLESVGLLPPLGRDHRLDGPEVPHASARHVPMETVEDDPYEDTDKVNVSYRWEHRYSLWSRFDDGIRMDAVSWFSVTPETIARHIARTLPPHLVVVDAFAGAGGNAIQFALAGVRVVAIELDRTRIAMARHNAAVYGVSDQIEFHCGDFLELARRGKLKGDAVFLAPPWGGPEATRAPVFDIFEDLRDPGDIQTLLSVARGIAPAVSLFLPKNLDIDQLASVASIWPDPLHEEAYAHEVDYVDLATARARSDEDAPGSVIERIAWEDRPRNTKGTLQYLGAWCTWALEFHRQVHDWEM